MLLVEAFRQLFDRDGLLPGVPLGGRVLTVSGGGDDGDSTGPGLLAGQDRVQPEADAPGPVSGPVVDDITFSSVG